MCRRVDRPFVWPLEDEMGQDRLPLSQRPTFRPPARTRRNSPRSSWSWDLTTKTLSVYSVIPFKKPFQLIFVGIEPFSFFIELNRIWSRSLNYYNWTFTLTSLEKWLTTSEFLDVVLLQGGEVSFTDMFGTFSLAVGETVRLITFGKKYVFSLFIRDNIWSSLVILLNEMIKF